MGQKAKSRLTVANRLYSIGSFTNETLGTRASLYEALSCRAMRVSGARLPRATKSARSGSSPDHAALRTHLNQVPVNGGSNRSIAATVILVNADDDIRLPLHRFIEHPSNLHPATPRTLRVGLLVLDSDTYVHVNGANFD